MFLGLLDVSDLFLSVLDVSTQMITGRWDGGLANISRCMVALLHIVPSACMGSSFSLCWCERLWVACILRCISNSFLSVLDVSTQTITGRWDGGLANISIFLAGVDSGVPVRKLMRYHVVFCAKSSLT